MFFKDNKTGTVFKSLTNLVNSAAICLQATTQFDNTELFPVFEFSTAASELLINNFIIGHGKVYPKQAYHKGSSCPLRPLLCSYEIYFKRDFPNPNLLEGGVINGPEITWQGNRNSFDYDFLDKRTDIEVNKVSLLQTANAQLLANTYISYLYKKIDVDAGSVSGSVSKWFSISVISLVILLN